MDISPRTKLFRSIFSYVSALIFSQLLMAIYTIGIIWWLSRENYGLHAANYGIVTITSFIINLGLHEWLVRTIPKSEQSKTLTGNIILFKIFTGFFWGLGLWVIMPILQPNIYQKDILAIIILDVWFDSCFNLLLADLLGHEKSKLTSLLLVLSRILRILSLFVIIFLESKSLLNIELLRLISTLIIFIISLYKTKPKIIFNNATKIVNLLRFSIIFNASELLNLLFLNLDINLLTWINGNQLAIGNFAITISLINMIMTVPLAITSLLIPNLIKVYQLSKDKFIKRIKLLILLFLFLGLLIFGVIWIFRINWLQDIIGQGYRNVIDLIFLASPILFFRTINQINRIFLIVTNSEKKQLLPQIVSIIVKLILSVPLTIRYGIQGLIIGSILSDFISLVGHFIAVLQVSKSKFGFIS